MKHWDFQSLMFDLVFVYKTKDSEAFSFLQSDLLNLWVLEDESKSKAETGSFKEHPVDGVSAVGDKFPCDESCSVDFEDVWSSSFYFYEGVMINNYLLLCFGRTGNVGLDLIVVVTLRD
jgi:hypothetical protein